MGRTQRLAQPERFGKYQLVARLAHGRMGDVYKAKSHGVEGFEKILVVKVINQGLVGIPDFVDTLIHEAKRAVALSHANVAQVYDLGREEDQNQVYIALEFVNGFDLGRARSLASRGGREWSVAMSAFVVSEAAKALDYAHRRKDFNFNSLNILHRDLCPQNIMLSQDGEVKVTDFGLARAMDFVPPIDSEDTIRRHLWVAPEVARGEEPTQKSDIYSLGLILYELLAGQHPYPTESEQQLLEAARQGATPPIASIAHIPRQLQQILESMLVPDPAGRAASAGTVYEELVGFLFGNNLRVDNRALSMLIQELRRDEQRIAPDERTQEVGLQEISMTEFRGVLSGSNEHLAPVGGLQENSEPTHTDLPSAKIQQLLASRRDADQEAPQLPGALKDHFLAARAGQGKAVLLSGQFGAGRRYLPDRLVEALGWRGNTQAFGIQTTRDDIYRPFGVLGDLLLTCLQDTLSGASNPREAAVRVVANLGAGSDAIDTLRGLWGLAPAAPVGHPHRLAHLSAIFDTLLADLCRGGPVVLVIDRVEHLDSLSLDVLRDVVSRIGKMPAMLVLATQADELMRSAFDRGSTDHLEAVRVVGTPPPEIAEIAALDATQRDLLKLLALADQPMSQADLQTLLSLPSDKLMHSLRALCDRGLIRVPSTGIFAAGLPDLLVWVEQSFERSEVQRSAHALARHYTHRAPSEDLTFMTPTLLRLYAYAGDRRRMLNHADRYSRWLERQGWHDIALEFYKHTATLLSRDGIGSPKARIRYTLLGAELALELARLDEARANLEPVAALTDSVRHERGFVRGQLLLAQMAFQQDDLVEARTRFRRAADAARGIHDPSLLARSLLGLAGWHERFGDTRAAQKMLEAAMNLFNRWGTYRMDLNSRATMLQRASRMWADRGMVGRANHNCDDLETLAQQSQLATVQCRASATRGHLLSLAKDYDEALAHLDQARHTAAGIGLTALEIEALRRQSAVSMDAGLHDQTISLSSQLIDLAQARSDLYSAQRGRDLLATARCILGLDAEHSLMHLQTSLERAQGRGVPRDVFRCHRHLASALQALGRPSQASSHLDQARLLSAQHLYQHVA